MDESRSALMLKSDGCAVLQPAARLRAVLKLFQVQLPSAYSVTEALDASRRSVPQLSVWDLAAFVVARPPTHAHLLGVQILLRSLERMHLIECVCLPCVHEFGVMM